MLPYYGQFFSEPRISLFNKIPGCGLIDRVNEVLGQFYLENVLKRELAEEPGYVNHQRQHQQEYRFYRTLTLTDQN